MARNKWSSVDLSRQFSKELISNAAAVNKRVLSIFTQAQSDFLDNIQANKHEYLPYITGNLHDSVASVVSLRGRVVKAQYLPTEAIEASTLTGKEVMSGVKGMGRTRIIGSQEAVHSVRNYAYPKGLGVTLFVAVPYAEFPNEKGSHPGYADELEYDFQKEMGYALYKYDNYNIFDRKKPII